MAALTTGPAEPRREPGHDRPHPHFAVAPTGDTRRRTAARRLVRATGTAAGWLALTVVGALALAIVVVPRLTGWVPLTILSGSMEPAIPTGSQVVVEPVRGEAAAADLRLGDVVTVMPYPDDPTLVTHRVMARGLTATGQVVLTTRGDANDVDDPWTLTATQLRGVVRYHVPYAGYLATALDGDQKRTGTVLLAVALWGYAAVQVVRAAADRRTGREDGDGGPVRLPDAPALLDGGRPAAPAAATDRTGERDVILDPGALGALARDVGADAATGFGLAYLRRLGDSGNRVTRAVVARDAEEVHVAALSLHTSAAMVGAAALARHAEVVAEAGRKGDLATARRELRQLVRLTNETQRALAEQLGVGTAGATFQP